MFAMSIPATTTEVKSLTLDELQARAAERSAQMEAERRKEAELTAEASLGAFNRAFEHRFGIRLDVPDDTRQLRIGAALIKVSACANAVPLLAIGAVCDDCGGDMGTQRVCDLDILYDVINFKHGCSPVSKPEADPPPNGRFVNFSFTDAAALTKAMNDLPDYRLVGQSVAFDESYPCFFVTMERIQPAIAGADETATEGPTKEFFSTDHFDNLVWDLMSAVRREYHSIAQRESAEATAAGTLTGYVQRFVGNGIELGKGGA